MSRVRIPDSVSCGLSFVGSRPCSEGFSPVFLPPQKPTFLNSNSAKSIYLVVKIRGFEPLGMLKSKMTNVGVIVVPLMVLNIVRSKAPMRLIVNE